VPARSVSTLAYLVAVVLFVLAGLVGAIGDASGHDLVAFGLAAFAAGHVLP
jgi:hypothetical protein